MKIAMEGKGFVLLGGLLVFLGIKIIRDPKLYSAIYQYTIDFTGYNIPLGIFIILVGIGFIWTSVSGKRRK
jgi:hypothetical protein